MTVSIKRFDIVRLLRQDNVDWVSGPPGRAATPDGNWIVVAGIDNNKFLLAKEETIIRIPTVDVFKVASYDISEVIAYIKLIRTNADLKRHLKLELENDT